MSYNKIESEDAPKGLRIIHVDDDLTMSKLVGINLKFAGYNFISLNHPQQVLDELVKQNDWQLLITDGQMSGMSGGELVETIRQTNNTIAALLLSGRTDLFKPGIFDAVRGKPFSGKDLRSGIAEAYNRRQDILRSS